MRTLLAGEGEGVCSAVGEDAVECSGKTEEKGDSSLLGQGVGVDDSCAAATRRRAAEMIEATKVTMRNLSIVSPVHVWKNVVPPFAVAQKFFIEIIYDKLIVQTVEPSKVIDRALSGIFARSPGFH